jgi:hypothetical protein
MYLDQNLSLNLVETDVKGKKEILLSIGAKGQVRSHIDPFQS